MQIIFKKMIKNSLKNNKIVLKSKQRFQSVKNNVFTEGIKSIWISA